MNILFVCTGNSCRTQIAEGFANAIGKDIWQVKSAGLLARGVNPHAVAVMKEIGIDISQQTSKTLTQDIIDWADKIILLCSPTDKHCPVIPSQKSKLFHPFADPALATGSEEEIMTEFRNVRDDISKFLQNLLTEDTTKYSEHVA